MNKFYKIKLYKKIFFSLLVIFYFIGSPLLSMDGEPPEKQGVKRLLDPDSSEEPTPKKARYSPINLGISLPFLVTNVVSFCIDLWKQPPFFRPKVDNFQFLPLEVHGYILSFIHTNNLLRMQMVSTGWRAVAAKTWKNSTNLDLRENKIGDAGALSFSRGNLSALTTLDLSSNRIGGAGALSLATGNLFALTTLDLSYNGIGDAGALSFSRGNLSALTTLDLGENEIGAAGKKSLEKNRRLLVRF